MTEQDAIKYIENFIEFSEKDGFGIPAREPFDIAVSALKEIQQYREIGTVDECKAARDKQIPETPEIEGDGYADGHMVYDTWICPGCGEHYEIDYDNYDFCPKCGQAINWEGCQRYTVEDALAKWGVDVKKEV